MPDRTDGLAGAAQHAQAFLSTLDQRPVAAGADASCVREALGGPLPRARPTRPLSSRTWSPRPIPGSLPAPDRAISGSSSAAGCRPPWPPTGWRAHGTRTPSCLPRRPQPPSPRRWPPSWLIDLLGLPAETSVGFVTGASGQLHGHRGRPPCGPRPSRLGRRTRWTPGRPAGHASSPTRGATSPSPLAGLLGLGAGRGAPDRSRRPGPDAPRRPSRRAGRDRRPGHRLCPGREREQRRVRSPSTSSCDRPRRAAAWVHVDGAFGIWAAASRRSATSSRPRTSRLLVDRRPQVAQRAL